MEAKFIPPIDMYPVRIFQSRYGGVYEGGSWICASGNTALPKEAFGDDEDCVSFWSSGAAIKIGVGYSPDDAYFDMLNKNGYNDEQSPAYKELVQRFDTDVKLRSDKSVSETMRSIRLERTNYFDSSTGFAFDEG